MRGWRIRAASRPHALTRLLLRNADGSFTESLANTVREGLQSVLPSHGLLASTVDVRPLYNDLLKKLADHFTAKGCDASAAEVKKLESLGWGVIATHGPMPLLLRALLLCRVPGVLRSVSGVELLERSVERVHLKEKKAKGCKIWACQLAASFPTGIGAGSVRTRRAEDDPLVIDVEEGWAFKHECVKRFESKVIHGCSNSDKAFHGTAVLSILAAEKDCGHFGLAPGVDIHLAAIRPEKGAARDEVSALAAALLKLACGDVLLLEFHHPESNVPAELSLPVFHLVRAATSCGVVVVEAAGNGHTKLKDRDWPADVRSSQGGTDSGAILVGGSTNPNKNGKYSRWSGSNYGKRIKVFAWAEGILVAGQVYGNNECFDGTSAATAIVAGCAVVIQRLALRHKQRRLRPEEVRSLLESYGTSVKGGGRVPDLEAIDSAIKAMP